MLLYGDLRGSRRRAQRAALIVHDDVRDVLETIERGEHVAVIHAPPAVENDDGFALTKFADVERHGVGRPQIPLVRAGGGQYRRTDAGLRGYRCRPERRGENRTSEC